MPEMTNVAVKKLSLDLSNFRTVPQKDESAAVDAMISASPDRFWALTDSLLTGGYLPTENIIVLRSGAKKLTVKEGNRRIASLKLIHGLLPLDDFTIPAEYLDRIKNVAPAWRQANGAPPCTIYDESDAATVDRIVTLAHGKGEKAGKDQWNAVARARHNRNANGVSEPALDLLEKYLAHGKNVTAIQAGRWAGDYPITVLAEAMKRLAPRLGLATSPALALTYPAVPHRESIEKVIYAIGQDQIGFDEIRRKDDDFAARYGVPAPPPPHAAGVPAGGSAPSDAPATSGVSGAVVITPKPKPKAIAINDPRAVSRTLKNFAPRGKNREKVVALKQEAERLNIEKTPMAFCFLLRSMFEISAKAYVKDHKNTGGPGLTKASGQEKTLAEILRDIANHLTNNKQDKAMVKVLHGAMAELAGSNGFLSVTSMNQLVHNPTFSVSPSHIATLFANVFPLLEAMNS